MKLITFRNMAILTVALITIWLVVRTLNSYLVFVPEEPASVPIPANLDLTLQNITYTKTHAGKPLWTLVAKSAEYLDDGITLVTDVHITFFDEEKGDIELRAGKGKLMPGKGTVTVSSNVVIMNPSGQTLHTDFLEYAEVDKLLRTDSVVQISTDDYIVTGRGMEIDVVKRSVTLLSDIKAEVGCMDGPPFPTECSHSMINLKKNNSRSFNVNSRHVSQKIEMSAGHFRSRQTT